MSGGGSMDVARGLTDPCLVDSMCLGSGTVPRASSSRGYPFSSNRIS